MLRCEVPDGRSVTDVLQSAFNNEKKISPLGAIVGNAASKFVYMSSLNSSTCKCVLLHAVRK